MEKNLNFLQIILQNAQFMYCDLRLYCFVLLDFTINPFKQHSNRSTPPKEDQHNKNYLSAYGGRAV